LLDHWFVSRVRLRQQPHLPLLGGRVDSPARGPQHTGDGAGHDREAQADPLLLRADPVQRHPQLRRGQAARPLVDPPLRRRRSIPGDWFFSGDRYRVDADGYYWYEGRSDDMIKVSGLWVSPVEIESALLEHKAVAESAVVGVSVEGFTRIKAFVIAKSDAVTGDALVAELQEH